jgi:carboxymethylenebutenolidase
MSIHGFGLERMSNSSPTAGKQERGTKMQATTNYRSAGKSISCELFTPTGTTNGGVIIVAYGSDGMINNAHGPWASMMREYATDLASVGFTALIPDYFLTTGTAAGSIDYQRGGSNIVQTHRHTWATAINDAVTHGSGLPGVDPKRVGLLGFSLGGYLCLEICGAAKALVSYFAPFAGEIGTPARGLHAQLHHGTDDKAVPFDMSAPLIESKLKAGGAHTELHRYAGAGHGFVGTDAANSDARSKSKARTMSFFVSKL